MTPTTTIATLPIHLDLGPLGFRLVAEEAADRLYQGTMMRPGIYVPDVGGSARGKRILIQRPILATLAPTFKGTKVDMEHFQDADNEVGFIRDAYMSGDALKADLMIQASRPKFTNAVGFIEGRLAAHQVPELSFEIRNPLFRAAEGNEQVFYDLELIGGIGAGVALVTRGACGAKQGCGIGMSLYDPRADELALSAPKPDSKTSNHHADLHAAREGSSMPCDEKCVQAHAALKAHAESAARERDAAFRERDDLRTQVGDLKAQVGKATTDLQAKASELEAASKTVLGYQAAERKALWEALEAAAPTGFDLKAAYGESPDVNTIRTALTAFKAMGSKAPQHPAGQGTGRFTHPTKRDVSPGQIQVTEGGRGLYEALREKHLGFSAGAQTKSKLPLALQRNTDAILGAAPGAATGKGGG